MTHAVGDKTRFSLIKIHKLMGTDLYCLMEGHKPVLSDDWGQIGN